MGSLDFPLNRIGAGFYLIISVFLICFLRGEGVYRNGRPFKRKLRRKGPFRGPNALRENGGFQNRRLPFLGQIWDFGPPAMLGFRKTKTKHCGGAQKNLVCPIKNR